MVVVAVVEDAVFACVRLFCVVLRAAALSSLAFLGDGEAAESAVSLLGGEQK